MDSKVIIALNEFSAEGEAEYDDEELLRRLLQTEQNLFRAITPVHRHHAQLAVPYELTSSFALPGGNLFWMALQRLSSKELELARHWKERVDRGLYFDDDGAVCRDQPDSDGAISTPPFLINDWPARGLRVARDLDGGVLSFDLKEWRVPHIPPGETGVPNAWGPLLNQYRAVLDAVAKKIWVLPEYENPGHHDPTSPKYQSQKSLLPRRPERLLAAALPADGQSAGTTWWAYCEHKFFHRFQGSVRDGRPWVHWNGTTNPMAKQNSSVKFAPTLLEGAFVVDLDRGVVRQHGDADGRARVTPLLAENIDDEIGGAVHHLRPIDEARRRIDETVEPHHAYDAIEIAERGLDLGEEIDGAGARGGLAVLDRHRCAELSFGDEPAVGEA